MVGGIVIVGKVQKLVEGLAVAHVGGILLLQQLQALAVIQPALELARVYLLVLPGIGPARLDDYVHVLRQLDLQHLRKVGGSAAVLGLQVAAAQIPVYRPAAVPRLIGRGILCAAGGQIGQQGQGQKQRQIFLHLHGRPPLRCPAAAASWR